MQAKDPASRLNEGSNPAQGMEFMWILIKADYLCPNIFAATFAKGRALLATGSG
jgi:hypothetical protein